MIATCIFLNLHVFSLSSYLRPDGPNSEVSAIYSLLPQDFHPTWVWIPKTGFLSVIAPSPLSNINCWFLIGIPGNGEDVFTSVESKSSSVLGVFNGIASYYHSE